MTAILEMLDDAEGLLVVAEAIRQQAPKRFLARVPERRMAQVVAPGDRLGKIFVEVECSRDRAGNLLHLDGVGHPRDHVVRVGMHEDLRLVLQPPERPGVDQPIAVHLERESQRIRLF